MSMSRCRLFFVCGVHAALFIKIDILAFFFFSLMHLMCLMPVLSDA